MIAPMKVQLLAARTSSDKREWGSEVSRKSVLLSEWRPCLRHMSAKCSLESFAAGREGRYMYLGNVFTQSSP